MPLRKPRRRGSSEVRYNHLDALGGIELKAYVATKGTGGAVIQDRVGCAEAFNGVVLAPTSPPPSC
jgi:hypothetical protein